jgi:hypothetical protein
MKISVNLFSWSLLFGRLSTDRATVNIALVGPVEFTWNERPGLDKLEGHPLAWLWSPSRVWCLELGRAAGAANAYGVCLAFDPDDPFDRAFRIQLYDFTIQLRWLPAHVKAVRHTMREARRIKRMEAMAGDLGKMLQELLGEQRPSGPMPDLRGRANLN